MENINIVVALIVFLVLIGCAIAVARSMRARQLREAEERRPQDKGKHVEL
jgi:hypothetical protein